MRFLSVLLFVVSLLCWIYVAVFLNADAGVMANMAARFGVEDPNFFKNYIPYAFTLAVVAQLITLLFIYFITARVRLLSESYKSVKTRSKELSLVQKENEKKLAQQNRDLQQAKTAEEQVNILKKQIEDMTAGIDNLRKDNEELIADNERLSGEAEKLRSKIESKSVNKHLEKVKNWFRPVNK